MSQNCVFLDASQQAVQLIIAVRRWSYFVFLKLNIKLHCHGSLFTDQASESGLRASAVPCPRETNICYEREI